MTKAILLFYHLIRPEAVADPYQTLARIRTLAPVLSLRQPGGTWHILTRYADCDRLLRDRRFVIPSPDAYMRNAGTQHQALAARLSQTFNFRDGAIHADLRAAMAPCVHATAVAAVRTEIAAALDAVLDRFEELAAAESTVDLMEELAVPAAAAATGALFGIDPERGRELARLARRLNAVIEPVTTPRQIDDTAAAATEAMRICAEEAQQPNGLLTANVRQALATHGLPHGADHVADQIGFLLSSSVDSSASSIGTGVMTLLSHPRQAADLRDDPRLLPGAIEELFRLEPPVQAAGRIAARPADIAGVPVAPGELVIAMLGAALRDPDRLADPDRFDIRRTPVPLNFGAGPHYCPGSALARLLTTELYPRLLRRFPTLRLAGPPVYRSPGFYLRGPHRLPVTIGLVGSIQQKSDD